MAWASSEASVAWAMMVRMHADRSAVLAWKEAQCTVGTSCNHGLDYSVTGFKSSSEPQLSCCSLKPVCFESMDLADGVPMHVHSPMQEHGDRTMLQSIDPGCDAMQNLYTPSISC